MAINTGDQYIASAKQSLQMTKIASRTSIAATWFSVFELAGNPGAGVLAGTSVAAGVVPTDATAGVPIINAFGGGATGYIGNVEFGSSVASRIQVYDILFKAGAYAFNANQTLASQPSYVSRLPGSDYNGTELWIEAVTAFTGNPSIAITYTNQAGTAARTTGTIALGTAPTLGRMIQMPLQAGDTGVQKIESVVATVASVGTFNVLVIRPLWAGRVKIPNDGDTHDLFKTNMPVVFADSALALAVSADSTSSGIMEVMVTVVNA